MISSSWNNPGISVFPSVFKIYPHSGCLTIYILGTLCNHDLGFSMVVPLLSIFFHIHFITDNPMWQLIRLALLYPYLVSAVTESVSVPNARWNAIETSGLPSWRQLHPMDAMEYQKWGSAAATAPSATGGYILCVDAQIHPCIRMYVYLPQC